MTFNSDEKRSRHRILPTPTSGRMALARPSTRPVGMDATSEVISLRFHDTDSSETRPAPSSKSEAVARNGSLIDLMDYTRCSELRYTDDDPSDYPNILLRLRSTEAELSLLLRAVKSVRFEVAPHLWLSELEILDIRERMLEGIRFLVQSQNGDGLTCYCEDIECLAFDEAKRDP